MKPVTIKVGTLVKIGLGVAALNYAMDLGKACTFKAVKDISPETADKMMEYMDSVDDYETLPYHTKIRVKIVRGLCKALTKE